MSYSEGRCKGCWRYLTLCGASWHACAMVCQGLTFRAATMSAAQVSIGFIDTQVWSRLRSWPWELAVGDIATNLEELSKMESPPMDSVSRKVWALLGQSFSRHQLQAGLSLLRHLGWSSATVEQQHASATLVHRQHFRYGMAKICSRALVHTARILVTEPRGESDVERLQARAQQAVDRDSEPFRFGPKHMYIKKAMGRAHTRHSESGASGSAFQSQGQVRSAFGRASKRYNSLPTQLVDFLRPQAHEERGRRAQERTSDMYATLEQLAEARRKQQIEDSRGLPPMLSFASCKFSEGQLAELNDVYTGDGVHGGWGAAKVTQLRKAALSAPAPLTEARAKVLDEQSLFDPPQPPQPWWLSCICACRSAFKNTALRFGDGDEARYYRFLYAKQKPLTAAFTPLKAERQDPYTPIADFDAYQGIDIFSDMQVWEHMFSCDLLVVLQAHEICGVDEVPVHVLIGLIDLPIASVVSDGPEFELPEFLAGLPQLDRPPPRKRAEGGRRAAKAKAKGAAVGPEGFLAANPWMEKPVAKKAKLDTFGDAGPGSGGSADPSAGESSDDESWDPMYDSDDGRVEDMHSELQKLRDAWHAKHGAAGQDDFGGGLLGGSFTKREFGAGTDYV